MGRLPNSFGRMGIGLIRYIVRSRRSIVGRGVLMRFRINWTYKARISHRKRTYPKLTAPFRP